MKLSEYKKLEESIKNQEFNNSFRNINKVMFYLSIFGHISSIFLAYFLVSRILSNTITNNSIIVFISSIILLGGLELLKREIFDKFSIQSIKYKKIFTPDVFPLFLISAIIVSVSFYCSITGAHEFSNKSKQIDNQVVTVVKTYEDSLNNAYTIKFNDINSLIKSNRQKIENKDKEQTLIESIPPLGPQQRNRVRDLKSEKSELKDEISKLEIQIDDSKKELQESILRYESKTKIDGEGKKTENKTNSFLFVVISTLIELIILAGVFFNEYYKYRSYTDFKLKIEKDPNFQRWSTYNVILGIIYTSESKINDKLPSGKLIADICKMSGTVLLPKDITEMFRLFTSLGIIRGAGSNKYLMKTKESAEEVLKKHFNID